MVMVFTKLWETLAEGSVISFYSPMESIETRAQLINPEYEHYKEKHPCSSYSLFYTFISYFKEKYNKDHCGKAEFACLIIRVFF
jgi:hypothetical protein